MDSLVSNYLTVYFVFDQAEFLLYVTSYRIHEKIKLLSDIMFKIWFLRVLVGGGGGGGVIMVLIFEELTLLQCIR